MPTLIVAVRTTGVSKVPHSRTVSDPVSSPAPLSTAVPAAIGRRNMESSVSGTIAVTPVHCPVIVECPTRTPGTSVIVLCAPVGSEPTTIPRSRRAWPGLRHPARVHPAPTVQSRGALRHRHHRPRRHRQCHRLVRRARRPVGDRPGTFRSRWSQPRRIARSQPDHPPQLSHPALRRVDVARLRRMARGRGGER